MLPFKLRGANNKQVCERQSLSDNLQPIQDAMDLKCAAASDYVHLNWLRLKLNRVHTFMLIMLALYSIIVHHRRLGAHPIEPSLNSSVLSSSRLQVHLHRKNLFFKV